MTAADIAPLGGSTRPWTTYVKRIAMAVPLLVMLLVVVMGLFGEILAPHDPNAGNLGDALRPPAWSDGGRFAHVLGTDPLGRDVLSRIMAGARQTLIVGLATVLLAGAIGAAIGLLSGYVGGRLDAVLMRFTDSVLSVPYLLVASAFAAILGPGLSSMVLVLGLTGWATYARVIRAQVLELRERDFVHLALIAGVPRRRVLTRHILPNVMNTLAVLGTLQLGLMINLAASLSFLGLGASESASDWGLMMADGRDYIRVDWGLTTFPGLAVVATVLSVNVLGERLRHRLDPKRGR